MLTGKRCWVLLAAAAWTLYVWGTRLFLLWGGDESTSFKVVHTVLAVVSIGFALAVAWIGISALRAGRRAPATPGDATAGSPSELEQGITAMP